MKRISFLLSMSAIALSTFLSSCGGDDEDPKPAPSINAYIGTSSVKSVTEASGVKVTITYTVTTGEDIEKIEVTERTVNGSDITTKPVAGFPKTSKFKSSTTDDGTVIVESTGSEVFYDFKVTDKKGLTMTSTVTLNPASEAKTFNSYTARLVGAQNNAEGSYFASSNGTVYKAADAQTNKSIVDITFAQIGSPTTTPRLISPDFRADASIGLTDFGGTTTYFKSSTLNFATVTDAQLNSITASTVKSIVVAQGSTYEFVNAAGKKGLINVTNYTAGSTGLNGSITIDVKVQK